MKKLLIAVTAALSVSFNPVIAQENPGGLNSINAALGKLSAPQIVAGAVGLGLAGAVVANNRGSTTVVVDPGCRSDEVLENGSCVPKPADPECSGSDPLVDGVCIGSETTITVTSSGTTTATRTIEVNSTFTYLPTVPAA